MIQRLKKIAQNFNCRVGATYPVINVERVSDSEFLINGYTVFIDMNGSWSSNPPINDVVLKSRVTAVLRKMKRCKNTVLCSPSSEFDMLEKCTICKRVS